MKTLLGVKAMAEYVTDLMQEGQTQLARASALYNYQRIITYMNSGYSDLTQRGQQLQRSELIAYENATMNSDTQVLSTYWPSNRGRILAITRRTGSDDTTPTKPEYYADYHQIRQGNIGVDSIRFQIVNDQIIVMNDLQWPYWRVWHIIAPPELHQATATAGTVNSITFPSSTDYGQIIGLPDYYKHGKIRILSGTGSGQEARISAYNATTRVATCESLSGAANAFETAPNSTSVYSLVPWFPMEFWELLPYAAALRFTKRETSQDLGQFFMEKSASFQKWLSAEDMATSPKITHRGQVRSGLMGDIRTWWPQTQGNVQ